MLKLKIKDFEGLNVEPFADKVAKVNDIDFLSELEEVEKKGANRVTALAAIDKRQGELYESAKAKEEEKNATTKETGESTDDSGQDETGADEAPASDVENTSTDSKQETGDTPDGPEGEEGTPGDPGINVDELKSATIEEFKENVNKIDDIPSLEDILELVKENGNTPEMKTIVESRIAELSENGITENSQEQGTVEEIPNEILVDYVKDIRKEIDRIHQFSQGHFRIKEKVSIKTQKGKAWLGKLLHYMKTDSPYEVGKIERTKDIPPTAEKNEGTKFFVERRDFSNKNVLDAVQELRTDLDDVLAKIEGLNIAVGREGSICRTNAWTALSEAKFELGYQLAEMRSK